MAHARFSKSVGRRPGLTLLETLISMGIVGIGIIGLFSLLPIAARQANNGAINDRKAALGQNAVAEFFARGLHQPNRWVTRVGGAFNPGPHVSFCIDPQVSARPIQPLSPPGQPNNFTRFPSHNSAIASMPRITVSNASGSLTPMGVAMADYLCMGQDDVVFEGNPDDSLPPLPQIAPQGLRETDGSYSWIATIAPRLDSAGTPVQGDRKQHTLSLVVYHNREFEFTGGSISDLHENVTRVAVPGDFYSGGVGGGDMRVTGAVVDDVEHIRKGSWVLLSASAGVTLHRWYRVIDVAGEIDTSGPNPTREITLDGPDWPFAAAPQLQIPQVTVVDGVVAVYERTVRFEGTTLWAD